MIKSSMDNSKCDKSQIVAQLKRVIEDDLFASAPRYVELLNYLVEMAMQGVSLKEFSIGEALFEGSYTIEKGSAIVRVHMYNLRKKLAEYYALRGANDPIIFYIPKRSYNMMFKANEGCGVATNRWEFNLRINLKWCGAIAAAILVILLISLPGIFERKEDYCWSRFFDDNVVNTCIMANHTSVAMRLDSTEVFVIHKSISNEEEYRDLVAKGVVSPQEVRMNRYKYFTKAIPLAIQSLLRWFYERGVSYDIIEEGEFKFDLTRSSNIIYIGQYKTMSVSRDLFLSGSKRFVLRGRDLYRRGTNGLERLDSRNMGNHTQEYAMVSYMALESGNKALYFVSNHDIGTMATISQFMSKSFLEEFYKELPSTDCYFNALFKVDGVGRVDIKSELVELEVVMDTL